MVPPTTQININQVVGRPTNHLENSQSTVAIQYVRFSEVKHIYQMELLKCFLICVAPLFILQLAL